jgi:hypothetical protein
VAEWFDFTSGDSSPDRSRLNLGPITPLSNEELSSLNTIKTAMELTVGQEQPTVTGVLSMLPLARTDNLVTRRKEGQC